jgi:adenylate cyclase
MAETRVERRLTAILAAGVGGYSGLMGADEVGTLRALQAHRGALIEPAIAEYKGRQLLRPREMTSTTSCGTPTLGALP